jgi:DNA-binding transcriptional LysR family regulator
MQGEVLRLFNWDDVRFFLTVHREGNLARAGTTLKLDPTTVGRRITGLEQRLGARLFDRTPKGYLLTAAGHRLLPRAEKIEREALAMERDVAGEDQRLAGTVRLTATEMLTTRFIAPFLGKFRERYPEIMLDLVCSNRDMNLSRREADIALRLSRPRQDNVIVKKLFEIQLALYASRDYIERFGSVGEPDGSLRGHQVIMFADSPNFARENAWIEERLDGGDVVLRSDSVSSLFSATVGGTGVALLPRKVADDEPSLQRFAIPGSPAPRFVWQAVHADLQHSARIRAVLDFLGRIFTPREERARPVASAS